MKPSPLTLLGPIVLTAALAPAQGIDTTPFASPSSYTIASQPPNALAFGLADADARVDLVGVYPAVTVPLLPAILAVWPAAANGCGAFLAPVTFNLAAGPTDVAVADLGAAGSFGPGNEILVTESGADQIEVFAGVYPGLVGTPFPLAAGCHVPIQLLVGDFNHDGFNDVLVLCRNRTISIHENDGLGGFLAPVPMFTGTLNTHFASGSFNGDELADLVIGDLSTTATVWLNTSTSGATPISFTLVPAWTVPLGGFPSAVTTGDFNGDGLDDIAFGTVVSTLEIAFNSTGAFWPGVLGFLAPVVTTLPCIPKGLARADFDIDGDLDIVYTGADGFVHVRENPGNGLFTSSPPETVIAVGASPVGLALADLDGDGDIDIGVSDPANFLSAICNLLPTGHCHHEFRAGIDDAFGASPAVENACPRSGLFATRNFDDAACTKVFAHTFAGLPARLRNATLRLQLAATSCYVGDTLRLDFSGPSGTWWSFSMPIGATVPAQIEFDLASLPGGLDLLPRLQNSRRLDVSIGLQTAVDYAELVLDSYCPDSEPVAGLYDHDALVSSNTANFRITAGAAYANGVAFLGFGAGVGSPGGGLYPGLCLLPSYEVLIFLLDGSGNHTFPLLLPPLPPCFPVHSQAVVLVPSNNFNSLGWSRTISWYTF